MLRKVSLLLVSIMKTLMVSPVFAYATEGVAGRVYLPLVTASGQTDNAQAEVAGDEDWTLILIGSFGGCSLVRQALQCGSLFAQE